MTSWSTVAALPDCPPVPDERVSVAEVLDGVTLRLTDGRELRLVSVLLPTSGAPETSVERLELAEKARNALVDATTNRDLMIATTGAGRDRYGRLLAHAFVEGDPTRWLQGLLVDKGLAQAFALADNYRCVGLLLDREAAARDARIGRWSTRLGALGHADKPEKLALETGRFSIVEGRVRTVGDRPRRVYLNFGKSWSEDFTAFVDRADVSRFEDAGIELRRLEGRTVRVRGWIFTDRGPAIQMSRPEQIEIVDER